MVTIYRKRKVLKAFYTSCHSLDHSYPPSLLRRPSFQKQSTLHISVRMSLSQVSLNFSCEKWNNHYILLKCKNIYNVKNRIKTFSMNYLLDLKNDPRLYFSKVHQVTIIVILLTSAQREEPSNFPVIICSWKPVHYLKPRQIYFIRLLDNCISLCIYSYGKFAL